MKRAPVRAAGHPDWQQIGEVVSTASLVVDPAVETAEGVPVQPAPDLQTSVERWYDRPAVGAWIVVGLAVLSVVTFTARIQTPWPWSDEGATYLALLRDWTHLSALWAGPDAPMVPYYYAAKVWVTALHAIWPALSTMVAIRLLSAAVSAVTVLLLYALVARNAGRLAGAVAGLALVGLTGFDRFAQEARPYAMLAMAATASWLMWDRWLHPRMVPALVGSSDDRDRTPESAVRVGARGAVYAVSLAAVAAVHTFGVFQWPAHALATLLDTRGNRRRVREFAGLVVVMLVAAAIAGAQVVASVLHGTGPPGAAASAVPVTSSRVMGQLFKGISATSAPAEYTVVLVLAAVGALSSIRGARAGFARSLLIWLCTPLALEVGLSLVKRNLLRLRYWIAFLPPLAALMAVGVVTLGVAVAAAIRGNRTPVAARPGRGTKASVAGAVALVAIFALGTQFVVAAPGQVAIRTAKGHGMNLAPMLKSVAKTRKQHPGVPVVITNRSATGIIAAVDPSLEAQNPLRYVDQTSNVVYTKLTATKIVRSELARVPALLWLYKGDVTAAQAYREMPHNLASQHRAIEWVKRAGSGWTLLMLGAGSTHA